MIKLALFASGTGSNVYNILEYLKDHNEIEVCSVLSNKKEAGALNHGLKHGVPVRVFNRDEFYTSDIIIEYLDEIGADYLILAGFLWKVPSQLINRYPEKILNVHPALLPAYGGKGMYGMNVHKAVIEASEKVSGITIHRVNENYDEGAIVAQFKCELEEGETPESLVKKIQQLEKDNFPKTIEQFVLNNK